METTEASIPLHSAKEVAEFVRENIDERLREEAAGRTIGFDEMGVLTRDEGFVIRTAEGHEFQITIVRSR